MSSFLMALDQGTTSSRCILFNKNNEVVSIAAKEFAQIYPKPGWVEHDPMEIWSSQLSVATECMAKVGAAPADIAAIGITNQRETTVVWHKSTGRPVCNAIVWQCRRTADYCESLKEEGFDQVIKQKTGLTADAYFSGTKLKWILENIPHAQEEAEKGNLLFGTIDTWLVWQLTKGEAFVTDYSNASRTMLFNIHTLQWDDGLLKKFNIPACMMPVIKPSSAVMGTTHRDLLGGEIPIAGIAGDQHAALFGQCCFEPGMTKNTYGTGCFTLMNTGCEAISSKNGLLTTIAWGIEEKGKVHVEYALEGSVFIAGAAIQWLRDGLRMLDDAASSEKYATAVEDTGGVYIVPAFVGLGAPYWDPYARGVIVGLTRGMEKEHFIRAALESIAYQSYDVIQAMMSDTNGALKQIRADGGASGNNFLMQFQADILNAQVCRPVVTESTAMGAAFLAGLAVGYYKNKEEIISKVKISRVFEPNMDALKRQGLLHGWKQAVKRSLSVSLE